MKRSRDGEKAHRINWAWKLLGKRLSPAKIVSALVKRFSISSRQAYRYLRSAEGVSEQLPIPEQKTVFSVKVPTSLVDRMRRSAKRKRSSVSNTVTEALEMYLER